MLAWWCLGEDKMTLLISAMIASRLGETALNNFKGMTKLLKVWWDFWHLHHLLTTLYHVSYLGWGGLLVVAIKVDPIFMPLLLNPDRSVQTTSCQMAISAMCQMSKFKLMDLIVWGFFALLLCSLMDEIIKGWKGGSSMKVNNYVWLRFP